MAEVPGEVIGVSCGDDMHIFGTVAGAATGESLILLQRETKLATPLPPCFQCFQVLATSTQVLHWMPILYTVFQLNEMNFHSKLLVTLLCSSNIFRLNKGLSPSPPTRQQPQNPPHPHASTYGTQSKCVYGKHTSHYATGVCCWKHCTRAAHKDTQQARGSAKPT